MTVTGILGGLMLQGSGGLERLAASPVLGDSEEVGVFSATLGVFTLSLQEEGWETAALQEQSKVLADILAGRRGEVLQSHTSSIIKMLGGIDQQTFDAAAKKSRVRIRQAFSGWLGVAEAKAAGFTNASRPGSPVSLVVGAQEYNAFVGYLIDSGFLKRTDVFPPPSRAGRFSQAGRSSDILGLDDAVPSAIILFIIESQDRTKVPTAMHLLIWGMTENGMHNDRFFSALLQLAGSHPFLFEQSHRNAIAREAESHALLGIRVWMQRVLARLP